MKVLCLFHNECAVELFDWIREQGHETVLVSEKLDEQWCSSEAFDLAVSYTYRYILSGRLLSSLRYNAVNIHNSFLPWNRGADPNLWSILEHTPRGVSIHYMDERLDCGDIIAQRLLAPAGEDETLRTTYDQLDAAAKNLFKTVFPYYGSWNAMRKQATGSGSFHRLSDAGKIKQAIGTYDISIRELKKIKYYKHTGRE